MKNEKFKSFILFLLIISSLVLSAYVWLSKELWPTGYNFFITIKNKGEASIPKESLSKPEKIVVTNVEKRSVFYNSDESFDPLYNISKDFIIKVLGDYSMVSKSAIVSESEWYNVLRNDELLDTKSIYLDYPIAFTPKLFTQIMGIKDTWINLSAVKEFIIAPIGETGLDMIFYIRDYNTGEINKYYLQYPNKSEFYTTVMKYTEEDTESYSFSFELNLHSSDTGLGTGVVQKVFLDPLVLISPEATETAVIRSTNPLLGQSNFEQLLSAFSYNPRSTRHYTDSNSVENFVENYSTLKIYSSGLIEYEALDDGKGINLFDSGGVPSLYESLNSAIQFSEDVWKSVVPNAKFDVLVTNNLLENASKPGTYTFTLDYYFEGTPITVDIENMNHAIEIEMTNGIITKYRHLIRKFEKTDRKTENIPMLMAIDGIYKNLSTVTDETRIKDIFLSYIEKLNGEERSPVWCAVIDGSGELITYAP